MSHIQISETREHNMGS